LTGGSGKMQRFDVCFHITTKVDNWQQYRKRTPRRSKFTAELVVLARPQLLVGVLRPVL
jgi:hypothetical protein